jgi:hypothetical protein
MGMPVPMVKSLLRPLHMRMAVFVNVHRFIVRGCPAKRSPPGAR